MKNKSGDRSKWKAEWLKKGGDEMIESLKKIQNEAVQSNMFNMHIAGKKKRLKMDNIIIVNAIIEKQRQSHKNTYLMQKNALTNYGRIIA